MAKIEERAGSFTTRISLTDPLTGKRTQKRVTARTKTELRALVRDLENRNQRGQRINPERTPLRDWLDTWLTLYRQSPHSIANREQIIRLHLKPDPISDIPIGLLARAHVQDYIDRRADAVGPAYLQSIVGTIHTAMEAAIRRGLIDTNPCTSLELPARHKAPWTVLSESEVRSFISRVAAEHHPAFWVLAVVLGIRRGELLALRWSDVDAERGTVTIQRTMSRRLDPARPTRRVWYIAEIPKTAAANRTIRLPRICLEAMHTHRTRWVERRLAFGAGWSDDEAVFDDGIGAYYASPNWLDATIRRFRRLGIVPASMRVHDLRHTAASVMLIQRIPYTTVSHLLGHATPATTLRVYGHLVSDTIEQAIDTLDAVYDVS